MRAIYLLALNLALMGCDGFQSGSATGNAPLGEPCVTATVTWTVPTKMNDGTDIPPGYLVGYVLSQGIRPARYTSDYNIAGATTDTFQVVGLRKNTTYYFAMKSAASDGKFSVYTGEVSFSSSECKNVTVAFGPRKTEAI